MAAPRFIFIPGSWHGAWCFDLLLLELQRRAVRCETLDLPGLGDDETPLGEVTFDAGVQRVVGLIGNRRNVTLVGHSFGAFYATEAAIRAASKIREVVYLASYVPMEGDSFSSQEELVPLEPGVKSLTSRKDDDLLELDPKAAVDFVYSDVAEGIAAAAATRIRPQPIAPFREAAISRPESGGLGSLSRRAIVAENDQVLNPEHCVLAAERAGVVVETIPTGHMPFLSMPKLLADTLLGVS